VLFTLLILRSLSSHDFEHAKVNKNDLRKKELKCLLTEGGELLISSITQTHQNQITFFTQPDLSQCERSWLYCSTLSPQGRDSTNFKVGICNKFEFAYLEEIKVMERYIWNFPWMFPTKHVSINTIKKIGRYFRQRDVMGQSGKNEWTLFKCLLLWLGLLICDIRSFVFLRKKSTNSTFSPGQPTTPSELYV